MSDTYALGKDGEPIEVSYEEWAKSFNRDDRRIAYDEIPDVGAVSTVFLGIEHGHVNGAPLLFESLVMGSKYDGEMMRYTTRAEAVAGHAKLLRKVSNDRS